MMIEATAPPSADMENIIGFVAVKVLPVWW